jgi:phosphoglycolate phosphatase
MKIVIFDMDGTLIDSKKDITISVNYIRKINHQLPPLSEDFIVEAINMEHRNLPQLFYGTELYEEKDRLLFEEHYAKQCTQNPYLYDGILELLKTLKNAGVKLGVATNAPTPFAKKMLDSLCVADMFEKIIGADEVKASKPDPEMLFKILDICMYNASEDKAWMVGDNSKDMKSAENANIKALFASWGFSSDSLHYTRVDTPKQVSDIVL